MIRTIILFLIVMGVVVISHEFGHFIIGRKNGIRVVEFAVGMGPTLFSFEKKGTKYSLKLLPIGGACMFDGEDGVMAQKEGEPGPEGMAFTEAGVWARIATVFAGPFFNFILAFVVAVILSAFSGADLPVVGSVTEGSAAQEAGLQQGDVITQIGWEPIHFTGKLHLFLPLIRANRWKCIMNATAKSIWPGCNLNTVKKMGVTIWESSMAGSIWSVIRFRYSSMDSMRWNTGSRLPIRVLRC